VAEIYFIGYTETQTGIFLRIVRWGECGHVLF